VPLTLVFVQCIEVNSNHCLNVVYTTGSLHLLRNKVGATYYMAT